jgi:1-acyl-sn-glycerol-3-phosphate acyltransferase
MMHWVYYFGRIIIRVLVFPVASWEVKGRENVPAQGPVLVVCNHLHLADPPIVAASIKLKSVFMAKEELFQTRWSRFWVQNFGAFPVRRRVADRNALKQAEHWLEQGVSLVMFPEGKRSSTGQLEPALPGSALIASRLGVPILPVAITGTEKLMKPNWWRHRPRIAVSIGQPFRLPPANGRLTREELSRLTGIIMGQIGRLLPSSYRGVYAGGENASPQTTEKARQ